MQSLTSYLDSVPLTFHEFKEFVVQEVQLHPVAAVAMVLFPVIGIALICFLGIRKIQRAMNSETEQKVSGVGQRILERIGLGANSPHEKMLKTALCVGAVGIGITAIGLALRYYYNPEEIVPDIIPIVVPEINKAIDNETISNVSHIISNVSDKIANITDSNVETGSLVNGLIDFGSYGLNMTKEILGSYQFHIFKITGICGFLGYDSYQKMMIENRGLQIKKDEAWGENYRKAEIEKHKKFEKSEEEKFLLENRKIDREELLKPEAEPIVPTDIPLPKKWPIYTDI